MAVQGLGCGDNDAVRGSGDNVPMDAATALQQSVSPEFLLRNVTLADAGCFCIAVPPYEGRANDPLDFDFTVQAGGLGVCNVVPRLERARRR